jgi:integrase
MSPLNSLILPKIGSEALESIDQLRLKEILEPVWHTKPVAARKALNRMNLAFLHAAALGLSVDLQACMKARALLGKQRHEEKHIPSLPYAEAPKFYKWLVELDGQSARALRFLMLTMARAGEVRLAERSQVTAAVWTIPAAHTKTGVERRVPLVASAQSLLQDGLLFPSPRGTPLSDMAMLKIMKKAGYDARPHGFRATFRTWCEECSDADYETTEACLGHAVDTGVQAAYQRSDRLEKRRALLSQWEHFLTA